MQPYTHFSLLKTLEGGFGLTCLNHACDAIVKAMSDLFGAEGAGIPRVAPRRGDLRHCK
jgi:hypothetical protein